MALEFRTKVVKFDLTAAAQREPGFVNFSRPVRTAECAIKGFGIRYGSGERPLHHLSIDVDGPKVDGTQVSFFVDFKLRDASGQFDDAFTGSVQVLVIADTQ